MTSARLLLAALAVAFATPSQAADPLRLQLDAGPAVRFAGYLAARDKGLYAAEQLNVQILPPRADSPADAALARGVADVAIMGAPEALAARAAGLPVVNIAQPFAGQGQALACRDEVGIDRGTAATLAGATIAVGPGGDDLPVRAWLARRGLSTDGGRDGVTLIERTDAIAQLTGKHASCASVKIYDQVLDLATPAPPVGGAIPLGTPQTLQTDVLRLADDGVATLEDGIHVLSPALDDPAMHNRMVRFVRATMAGWRDVAANPDQAAQMLAKLDGSDPATQRRKLDALLPLIGSGAMDPAAFDATIAALGAPGANPHASWTPAITDEALPKR